jgi:outer membrane protein OmpA-like peptidoglycan-associated protein
MGKSFYLGACLAFLFFQAFGQKAQKDSLVDRSLYQKNIKIYRSILKSGPNLSVSLKLAEALRQIGSLNESAIEYGKIMDKPGLNPIYYKNYSEVLCGIGEKEECERWKLRYKEYERRADKLSDAHVELDTGAHFINRVSFNSVETDFGPTFYKKGILFVSAFSGENKNTVHVGTGESFYQFYYAERKEDGTFGTPRQVFKEINTTMYEGPMAISTNFSDIYLIKNNLDELKTKSKDKSVKLQLVRGKIVDDEIKDIRPFEYYDGIHSFSNPSLSFDGQELYFVSNMDTINGSIDIYVSKLQNGSWGKPENLGPIVNSSEDEMYPYITKSGKLYFSSQRNDSYGGLDIYMTERKNGVWTAPVHLPAPINSIFDDFSFITDENSSESFLASNRAGSLGSDDIFSCTSLYKNKEEQSSYQYRMISLVDKDNFMEQNGNKIKGTLKRLSPDVNLAGVVVQLLDKNKKVVRSCHVTKEGYFSFSNIHPDDYMIVYEKEKVNAVPEIVITNKNPNMIDPEDIQKFKIGYVLKDSLNRKTNGFVVGRLVAIHDNNSLKEETVSLLLVDSLGKVMKRVVVGKNSFFIFRNLPSDNYFIVTEDNNPNYHCQIQYHNPDQSKSISRTDLLQYHYKHLTADSLRENNIVIHGQLKEPLSENTVILLMDANDNVIDRTVTNRDGYFVFRELDGDDMHMFIVNDHPNVKYNFATVYQAEDSIYHVTRSQILKKLPFDEGSIDGNVVVHGRLTLEGKPLSDRLILLVDKDNRVVKHTKTNEDGFFAFHKLKLDDFYIVVDENEKGYSIDKRINIEDSSMLVKKSDFHKLEKCKDCFFAVQGNAFNRSTKAPLENRLVLLMDPKGRVVRQTVVSKNGKFTFTNLQPEDYLILFENYNPEQTVEMKVIQDVNTKLVQKEGGKTVTYSLPVLKEENKTVLFFELRSDEIDKKYINELKKLATAISHSHAKRVEVLGYADMSGKGEYNLALSERRAKNCILILNDLLKDQHIPIIEKAEGATNQFINTYGSYIPALNRRVEIILTD